MAFDHFQLGLFQSFFCDLGESLASDWHQLCHLFPKFSSAQDGVQKMTVAELYTLTRVFVDAAAVVAKDGSRSDLPLGSESFCFDGPTGPAFSVPLDAGGGWCECLADQVDRKYQCSGESDLESTEFNSDLHQNGSLGSAITSQSVFDRASSAVSQSGKKPAATI